MKTLAHKQLERRRRVHLDQHTEDGLQHALEALAPRGVSIAAGEIVAFDEPLMSGEARFTVNAVPSRQLEFRAGRAAARLAMTKLGVPPSAIPSGPDRAPRWPRGLVGSISHAHGHVTAAIAHARSAQALGIDIEAAAPLAPDVAALVCRGAEGLPCPAHIDRGKLCFVIKEAAFKAYYPATAYFLDFDQVFVEIMGDHEARVLLPAEPAPDLYGHRFIDVRFSQTDDMLAAIAFREA